MFISQLSVYYNNIKGAIGMPNFVLTCCSTADMSKTFFEERSIPFACFHFLLNGKEYNDDLGLSMPIDEFYQRIKEGAQPTTSQVNTNQYIDMFEPLLMSGKDIIHITLSSGISGTYNSCTVAADEMRIKFPERKIIVIDSLCASSGYGLLVDYAADLRDADKSIEEAAKLIEEAKLHVHHWFFSTDLTSYFRGGRISKTSAFFGTLLNICPLLNMNSEGKLIPRDKYRGIKKVSSQMVSRMEQFAENGNQYNGKCFISQSACYEDAKYVANLIESAFPNLKDKVLINDIGTVIGSHTGPGTIALFFFGNTRTL